MGSSLLGDESVRASVCRGTGAGAETARCRRLVRRARAHQHRLCRASEHEEWQVNGPQQNRSRDPRCFGPEVDRAAGVSIEAAGLLDGSTAALGEDFDHGKRDERHGIASRSILAYRTLDLLRTWLRPGLSF